MNNKYFTVIGHSDLISGLNKDLDNLKIPKLKPQISTTGLKKIRPVLVLASLCPYEYEGDKEMQMTPEKSWLKWQDFVEAVNKNESYKIIDSFDKINICDKKHIQLLLHIEGAEVIEKIEDLDKYILAGCRAISLTWNYKNQYAGGAFSKSGLTVKGKKLLKKIEQNNLLLDLSHLNEKTFWQVLEYYKKPVIVTHSNYQELANSPRNLTKKQLLALRKQSSWIGISFARSHLTNNKKSSINDIVNHIIEMQKIVGSDSIGLGTDLGGVISGMPKGLENVEQLQNIKIELKKAGFNESKINNFYGDNFINFLKKSKFI